MLFVLSAAALALQAVPADPVLSQEQRALLRCSAAFALVAEGQARGEASAGQYPPLQTRGREFFVRALAQVMGQTGADRAAIDRLVRAAAQGLQTRGEVDRVMPACLIMLEASGL